MKTGSQLKRTRIRKVGKVGHANREARTIIADIAENMGLNYCEIGLPGCLVTYFLAPAHRNKRSFYRGNSALLAAYEQWVSSCQKCHDQIEHNKTLTEAVFERLRPSTKLPTIS
jgi:hypothetical protein